MRCISHSVEEKKFDAIFPGPFFCTFTTEWRYRKIAQSIAKGPLNRLQSLRKSGANLGPNSLFVRDRLQQRALRQS